MTRATRQSVAYDDFRLKKRARRSSADSIKEVSIARKSSPLSIKQIVLLFAVAATAIIIIYNYMILTELTDRVSMKTSQIEDLDNEYTYLKSQQENMLGLSYVEEYAQTKLNMIKMDSSQVEYVELSNPDHIEVSATSEIKDTVSLFAKSFNAVLEFIK